MAGPAFLSLAVEREVLAFGMCYLLPFRFHFDPVNSVVGVDGDLFTWIGRRTGKRAGLLGIDLLKSKPTTSDPGTDKYSQDK